MERPQRFFSFLEPMYYGFCDLLWKYILSFGKLEESELRKLPRGGVNPIRSNLDMIFGIRGLLYTGDAFYDSVNISVFALRCYIESWIRETFDIIISVDGNYIPIGIAINCIKKCSEKNSTSDKFNKYMISISKINDWSNFYIHWKVKPVFWTPHFVFMSRGVSIFLKLEWATTTASQSPVATRLNRRSRFCLVKSVLSATRILAPG